MERNIIQSGNLGQFYKHINSRLNHRSGIAPLLNSDGVLATNDLDKANILNLTFASFGTVDNGNIPTISSCGYTPLLNTVYFDSLLISQCICSLNVKSSAGPDGLPSVLFKELQHQLSEPLALLFRLYMQLGEVPDSWKQATATPIF